MKYEGDRVRNLYQLGKIQRMQVDERELELMRRMASVERSMTILQEELLSLRLAFMREPSSLKDVSELILLPSNTYFSIDYFDGKVVLHSESPILIDSKTNGNHTVSGWAVDKEANDLAGGVFVTIDGQVDICAYYGLDRPDVSDSLKNPRFRFSGYRAVLPSSILKKGFHVLSIKIVAKDGRGYYYPTQKVDFRVD